MAVYFRSRAASVHARVAHVADLCSLLNTVARNIISAQILIHTSIHPVEHFKYLYRAFANIKDH